MTERVTLYRVVVKNGLPQIRMCQAEPIGHCYLIGAEDASRMGVLGGKHPVKVYVGPGWVFGLSADSVLAEYRDRIRCQLEPVEREAARLRGLLEWEPGTEGAE